MNPKEIHISDYNYPLPDELIAKHPLACRDACRLLVRRPDGQLDDCVFGELPSLLPDDSLLVYNNTRVINARLRMNKESGALIEIFCLEPVAPADYAQAFASTDTCVWKCFVGNSKRWKQGMLRMKLEIDGLNATLCAERVSRDDNSSAVRFSWDDPRLTFARIIGAIGEIPIPPYLNRATEASDSVDYQTVFSQIDGSVAAPTAGLHFTPQLLKQIQDKGVEIAQVTLHVGLGTFRPVKVDQVSDHHMHSEYYEITQEQADKINRAKDSGHRVIAVGTTSTRTLESVADADGHVKAAGGWTQIFIYPGYKFKAIDAQITNFHLPKSTLIMLVSAFAGRDFILKAYEEAVNEKYRFFSFGDAMFIK